MRFYLGIDVSKNKLDCCLLEAGSGKRKAKSVKNQAEGVAELVQWCAKQQALVADTLIVMEPTGCYHEQAALALTDAGFTVSLVNPLHLRRFAESLGVLTKTDAADAALLARFGHERHPAPWQPPRPAVRQLQALLGRREALAVDVQREANRLEQAQFARAPKLVLDSIRASLKHLEKQLRRLDQAISEHIDKDPDLRHNRELLLTIPGVGERVANRFTALLADARFERAEQLAAYLGLTPVEWQSGSSVRARARLSKKGPGAIRALLYMPAVVAKQHNAHVKALYERLLARGKSKMAAIGAAMRKLVHLCFGVLKTGQPYSPAWDPKNA